VNCIGYLEDGRSLLLYRTPKTYVVFPKPILVGREAEFLTCAKNKVAPYTPSVPKARLLNVHQFVRRRRRT